MRVGVSNKMLGGRSYFNPNRSAAENIQALYGKATDQEYNQCTGETRLGRCINNVNARQTEYSKGKFGRVLCWSCQHVTSSKK